MAWIEISYREFYDVPRVFIAVFGGTTYIFDCPFDDAMDEYPDHYNVYVLEDDTMLHGSWEGIDAHGQLVGVVPVSSVAFDETKRRSVDDSVFTRILPA